MDGEDSSASRDKSFSEKKLIMSFPKSVYFIVGNEFCERFCYYGMRTVLFLYFVEILRYPKETATFVYHTFTMLSYFFPLMGAIVSDSWLGKYPTILYLSIVYVIGQICLSASSTPWFNLPLREMSLLGLFLISLGTGGIKPCIASFGAEQFKLPEQDSQLSTFFTTFFIAINSGSLISTFTTPILRKDITCFGLNSCYPLAFLVPSILMVLALVIFVGGSRMYKKKKPEGNVSFKVTACICHAIKRKIFSSKKKKHWLDYAKDSHESKIVDDTKTFLSLVKLFFPLTVFYALYEQVGSRWTYQATRMDGETFGYLIKPDQLLSFNILLFLIILIVSDKILFPLLERFLFINTPLRKLTFSSAIAATSFVVAALLQIKIESTYDPQPAPGLGQIRIFNTINCPVDLSFDDQKYKLDAFGLYQNLSIPVTGNKSFTYHVKVDCWPDISSSFIGSINVEEEKAISYLLKNDGIQTSFFDKIDKSETGDPIVRAMILNEIETPANLSVQLDSSESYQLKLNGENFFTKFIEVNHNTYNISVGEVQLASGVSLKSGGVYTILGRLSANGTAQIKTATVVEPNSVHMLWMLPQLVILTLAEIIFFITGIKFTLTEAPDSLKTTAHALWLCNQSLGNLIVVILTKANFFNREVFDFFMYAGLMYLGTLIFSIMAISYRYVDISIYDNPEKDDSNSQAMKKGIIIDNEVYSERL